MIFEGHCNVCRWHNDKLINGICLECRQKEKQMEKQMELQEAYEVMQAEWVRINDMQVGDEVRVVIKFGCHEMGYDNTAWYDPQVKKETMGCVGEILAINNRSIKVKSNGNWWRYPFFALEIVDQPREAEAMIEIRGKKWSEDTIVEALRNHSK